METAATSSGFFVDRVRASVAADLRQTGSDRGEPRVSPRPSGSVRSRFAS